MTTSSTATSSPMSTGLLRIAEPVFVLAFVGVGAAVGTGVAVGAAVGVTVGTTVGEGVGVGACAWAVTVRGLAPFVVV